MLCDTCHIYNAGCLPACGHIALEQIVINDAGYYTAEFYLSGICHIIPIAVENAGDPIVLPLEKFPINREIILTIKDADEAIVVFEIDEVQYTQIMIKLQTSSESGDATPVHVHHGTWEEVIAVTESGDVVHIPVYPNVIWQEVIDIPGSDTFTTAKPIYSFDVIQVVRDGVVLRRDPLLEDVNTYKYVSGSIVLPHPLAPGSYLQITKI